MNSASKIFDLKETAALLEPEGPISRALKGYEMRTSQIEMLRSVCQGFEQDHISLIEAGTGTGKSVAYLVPAILWALETGQPTVISTNTIALQQQLIEKDIPFLKRTLDVNFKAVLVKGMHNYLCMRKLESAQLEMDDFSIQAKEEFLEIKQWAKKTQEGSRHELVFKPTSQVWEKVMAEAESCTYVKCPFYKECHFFLARKKAQEAQLIIANHHLLFADLSLRGIQENYESACVLPPYERLIIDEAHHIEDVATEYFAKRVSRLGLVRTLGRLLSDRKTGKLLALRKKIEEFYPSGKGGEKIQMLLSRLLLDLPTDKRKVVDLVEAFFCVVADFLFSCQQTASGEEEKKLRFRISHQQHSFWVEKVQTQAQELLREGKRFLASINCLREDIASIDDAALEKGCSSILADIAGIATQIEVSFSTLLSFVFEEETPHSVRWIDSNSFNISMITAELEIGTYLKEQLFEKMRSTLLCSATLANRQDFSFIRHRLGLVEELPVTENIYASPFDFANQALLAVPSDIPPPSAPDFIYKCAETIWEVIKITQGGMFVLFTSYAMLAQCEKLLKPRIAQKRYPLYCQGQESRHVLLDNFRKSRNSILFGTDSFWEGVDVVGDALRCVILAKLPFKVPTEPLVQARSEAISKEGGSPFFEYLLPQAVMKFKQGFGRLIRNRSDRGCILCLDSRLIAKSYGKIFLRSLPNVATAFEPAAKLPSLLKNFYKKSNLD